jgi:phosphodiesterase family protein
MKYMILSDIHGSVTRLRRALDIYKKQACDMLIILGDILNYGPRNAIPEGLDAKAVAEELNKMADNIIAIRGNCDSEVDQMLLHFPIMSTYTLLVDEGRRIFLTHGHIYNKEQLPKGYFDMVCYGHTHLWEITPQPDGPTIVNTGSITFPKGGNPPTLAILDGHQLTMYRIDGDEEKAIGVNVC